MNTVNSIKILRDSIAFAFGLTMFSMVFSHYMGWVNYDSHNIWEVLAAFTSFSCTWMCVHQTRWNYPMAVISTMLLAYVFWEANLLASAALNIYLIPTVIYGWFIWGSDKNTRPVLPLEPRMIPVYILFTGGAYVGAWAIVNYLGGEMAALDSWLLIGSIFAQFLLDRKRRPTWIVWIIVDVVSIYVYFQAGLYLLALQFFFFLLNAFYGWFMWTKTMEKSNV